MSVTPKPGKGTVTGLSDPTPSVELGPSWSNELVLQQATVLLLFRTHAKPSPAVICNAPVRFGTGCGVSAVASGAPTALPHCLTEPSDMRAYVAKSLVAISTTLSRKFAVAVTGLFLRKVRSTSVTTPGWSVAVAGSEIQAAVVVDVTDEQTTVKAVPTKVAVPAGNWPSGSMTEEPPSETSTLLTIGVAVPIETL